jgi:hypothetical protein
VTRRTGQARAVRPAKLAALAASLLLAAAFAATAQQAPAPPRPPAGPAGFAGDASCLSCHQGQSSYLTTAHHLTSRPAARESIAGSFAEGANVVHTANPELVYRMEARKDGFFQTAVLGGDESGATLSERFDVVIGSGRKGQTYLYWSAAGELFQLPISYWTEPARWTNSPGYEDGELNFSRPITGRCLECHAGRIDPVPGSKAVNRFDRASFVLGISCERCHGPGAEHAALAAARPAKPSAATIVNPKRLPRGPQVEGCAICHAGLGVPTAPPFSFVPGKRLNAHVRIDPPPADASPDVHGNQVALLQRSRCYQASSMTCSTCHDVHKPQRDAAAFSKACLGCHTVESCKLFPHKGASLAANCVDCHMPLMTSNAIVSVGEGRSFQPRVRTHWIKAYPAPSAAKD